MYFGVFILVVSLVSVGYRQPESIEAASVAQTPGIANDSIDKPSVDEVVATDVAANLAEQTNMPVAANVANLSVSLAAKSDLAQTSEVAISKPQIIQPTAASRDITTYVAKAGDTVQSIAAANSISPETVRWANNFNSDAINPGASVTVPPIDGVVYTVKNGDTPESIAGTYHGDKDRIIAFNDLEIGGFAPGKRIMIPGGKVPEPPRPAISPATYRGLPLGSGDIVTGGNPFRSSSTNGYAYGYCTWYAFERRQQLGRPIGGNWGNAATWAAYARAAGFRVDHSPEVGAVMQNGGGYGHVAIVEQVNSDGSISLSEMNYAGGWGKVTRGRTLSAGQAASFNFIH